MTIPQTKELLTPKWSYLAKFCEDNKKFKESQKRNFDRRHGVKDHGDLDDADVWVTSETRPIRGRVVSRATNPRSYVVETPTGELQRNSTHLNVIPERQTPTSSEQSQIEPPRTSTRRIVTGTAIHPPNRLS